ncbi:MAG: ribonuclease HI [Bacteroidales bacterium]|nr:ribonuclease HI [Bacteroidales bacterium]
MSYTCMSQSRAKDLVRLKMVILGKEDGGYRMRISHKNQKAWIHYGPDNKTLKIQNEGQLAGFLYQTRNQLESILRNKKDHSFYPGFKLRFVLEKNPTETGIHDKEKTIVVDKMGADPLVYTQSEGTAKTPQIFTDGSFQPARLNGGYSIILREPHHTSRIETFQTKKRSSNLIELMAVIRGLEMARKYRRVQVVTDSQYVIKGISRWIYHWKLNSWRTANARRVKNKKQWKQLDRLMNNRCVEFKWVRAHEKHAENNLCDHLAKQAARNPRKKNYPLTKCIHKTKSAIRGIFLTINQRSSINTIRANTQKW